jgi:DNA polymerase
MDEPAVRARLRLWLSAEKAFGLSSVRTPAILLHPSAPGEQPEEEIAPPDGPRHPVGGSNLFGEVAATTPMLPPSTLAGPIVSPPHTTAEKLQLLQQLDAGEVKGCTRCRLCETRTHTVFGEGDPDSRIFFIGEGPGENEDLQGRPFVGRAGDLLNRMIAAMGLKREQVFIANIVKCRPPQNRAPAPDEVETCTPYLVRQLEIVRPSVIVTLGLPASRYMLQSNDSMGRLRGRWHEWRGIKLMPTYHPAFLLRSYTDANRAAVWSDLQAVMKELGMPIPARRSS